jgi:hypothetical protein
MSSGNYGDLIQNGAYKQVPERADGGTAFKQQLCCLGDISAR